MLVGSYVVSSHHNVQCLFNANESLYKIDIFERTQTPHHRVNYNYMRKITFCTSCDY